MSAYRFIVLVVIIILSRLTAYDIPKADSVFVWSVIVCIMTFHIFFEEE